MCTYQTVCTPVDGSAKGPAGNWFHVTDATVYYDHPVHAMAEHTLNIDLADPTRGPATRVAIELTPASAQELVDAIQTALAAVPPELLDKAHRRDGGVAVGDPGVRYPGVDVSTGEDRREP